MNLKDMALRLMNANPKVKNNPQAQEFIQVIQSGDDARGQQIAQNLCDTYGVSKEEALNQAKGFLFDYQSECHCSKTSCCRKW